MHLADVDLFFPGHLSIQGLFMLYGFFKFSFLNQKLVAVKRHNPDRYHSDGNAFPYACI
jgi:hypothetical protein